MFPLPMEHLPADPANAAQVSVRMVDEADLYIGIFAHRYGFLPPGSDISVTELEYNRSVERGIPGLIFFMHDDHPVRARDVETGPGAEKLARLKERIGASRVAAFFKSPEDLRGHVIQALEAMWKQLREAKGGEAVPIRFHPVSAIPAAPEPYIAHSYALLQTGKLIGRQQELSVLTDWVTGQPSLADVAVLAVVAIGGMGKSALTWDWFQTVAEQVWPTGLRGALEGRLWWSFYESDAHFENFIVRALAYVLGRQEEEVRKSTSSLSAQSELLVRELHRRPFLVVLDGLERILAAYAAGDSAHQVEEQLDDETVNRWGEELGLPVGAGQMVIGRHPQRETADSRIGQFLRRLLGVRRSRVLVSSRLFPAVLQNVTGEFLPGCDALFIAGLSETDALDLWRALGARGSREQLLSVFDTFERHPLLIQILAGVVAEFRDAPGEFDAWLRANTDFSVFGLPLVQVRSHILEYALRGLAARKRKVLQTVAGIRMPVGIATLRALFVEGGQVEGKTKPRKRMFRTFKELDSTLIDLEDRGLLGWDRHANRYDLHPIVRGVIWDGMAKSSKRGVQHQLYDYFQVIPPPNLKWDDVDTLDKLTSVVELYHTLAELGRHEEGYEVFMDRLDRYLLDRLGNGKKVVEMLERLVPRASRKRGGDLEPESQTIARFSLGTAYVIGNPQPTLTGNLFPVNLGMDVGDILTVNFAGGLAVNLDLQSGRVQAGLQFSAGLTLKLGQPNSPLW
jgi:hypothetical protein